MASRHTEALWAPFPDLLAVRKPLPLTSQMLARLPPLALLGLQELPLEVLAHHERREGLGAARRRGEEVVGEGLRQVEDGEVLPHEPLDARVQVAGQHEALLQIRVDHCAALFLDDLHHFHVGRASQAHDGVNTQIGEMILVMQHDFRTQCRARNVQQVLSKCLRIR